MPTGGSFDLDGGYGVQLSGYALSVAVYAYDPSSGYSLMPNIFPLRVDRREGCVPSAARFAYIMDDALDANFGWPSRFEQIFGLYVSPNPYVAYPDARLVIVAQNPDGSPWVLWDGFAQMPEMSVDGGHPDGGHEHCTFAGVGVESRCWDTPIAGAVCRDSDSVGIQDTSGESDTLVFLLPRFNPSDQGPASVGGSLPNRSPSRSTDPDTGFSYYVFIDPTIQQSPDPRNFWSVSDAVQYVLGTQNGNQAYVQNPPFEALPALLQTYAPPQGSGVMGPGSATTSAVQVPDYDAGNHEWPEAVNTLVAYCGFLARFVTITNGDGTPLTVLDFYRRDEFSAIAPKQVYLQPEGAGLDPTQSNATTIELSLDANAIINAYVTETDQQLFEISVILAPLYQPSAGDAAAANRPKFRLANIVGAPASVQRAYRWYGVDCTGNGHWTLAGGGQWSTLPADFDWLFPPDDNGYSTWTVRNRPGSRTLLATDNQDNPLKADLSISFDYTGASRTPWDGTGTWQSIQGGWRLLTDDLGIEVTADDPENWSTGGGNKIGGAAPAVIAGGGDIRGITWWANPSASGAPTNGVIPSLRLTTVISGDLRINAQAQQRIASPTTYARTRIADRRDMFGYCAIDLSSMNWSDMIAAPGAVTNDYQQVLMRDDTAAATGLAEQLRGAREFPTLSGRVTIPYITSYYEVGDRIDLIVGRNCSLCTNIAVDQGEAPTYPWVVGVSWDFDGKQTTTLTLSDQRALPHPTHGWRAGRRRRQT
jgi:hypothetical protein